MRWNKQQKRVILSLLLLYIIFPVLLIAQSTGTDNSFQDKSLQDIPLQEISLKDALTEALKSNPQAGAAAMKLRQAEAGVRAAKSSLLPDLVTIGNFTRNEEPALVYPMHAAPSPTDPLDFENDIYSGIIRLDVPILDLSALSGIGVAKKTVDAQRAQNKVIHQDIMAGIIEVFIQTGQISDNLTLIESHIKALERRQTELKTLAQEGRVSPAYVAEAGASLNSAISDRLELLHLKKELGYRLGSLLGRKQPVYPGKQTFSFAALNDRNIIEETFPAGPKTLAAEAGYAAAQAGKDAAQFSFAPRVDGFAVQSLRSGPEVDFLSEWSVGLTVTLPIFTGGERLALLGAAEASAEAARYERDSAMINDRSETSILRSRWENTAVRRSYLTDAVQNQMLSVTATDSRYKEGRSSLSDLLTEETTLLELRMRERSLLYEQLLSYIAYYQIAGKLSPSIVQTFIEE